jgi:intraflagellar transport protein 81
LLNLSKHRVKAYLARFLVPLKVPEDVEQDDVFSQYRTAMDDFREVHRQLTQMRDAGAAVDAVKRQVSGLVAEKNTLNEKLERSKKKVSEVPNGLQLLAAASEVRQQMDERGRAAELLEAQKEKLGIAKSELARVQDVLKEVQTAVGIGGGNNNNNSNNSSNNNSSIEGLFKQLEDEVKTNKFLINNQLPQEINAMKEWKGLLDEVLSEPTVTEATRAMLHQELTSLRGSVKELGGKRAAIQQPGDEQLGMYRQQAAVVERKKEEVESQLKVVQSEMDEVKREYNEKQKRFEAAGGDARMLQAGQLEAFIEGVQKKAEEVKGIKNYLSDLKSEMGVLSRTKDILMSKDSSCSTFVAEFEAKGMIEPKAAGEKLEDISQKKQEIEQMKGNTLQELTKVIAEMSVQLQERRTKLAPLVKELRGLRSVFQEVESEHMEKKREYDTLMLQIENERGKTELEKRAYREDWQREEARWHTNQCMMLLLNVQQYKTTASEVGGGHGKTYLEVYGHKSKQQAQQSEMLRAKQAIIKETVEPNLAQAEMFNGLKKLMTLKLNVIKKPKTQESTGTHEGTTNRLTIQ